MSIRVQSGIGIKIRFQLVMDAYDGTSYDFSHTAQLSMLLPTGVTYSFQSGNFLTASPIPLRASAWLLLSGLGGLSATARRLKLAEAGIAWIERPALGEDSSHARRRDRSRGERCVRQWH